MSIIEFSVPMPYTKEGIDCISTINKQVKKSKITSMYFGLPVNSDDYTGFEQGRSIFSRKNDLNYWFEILKYLKSSGFEFIYLINSPVAIGFNDENLPEKFKKLDYLVKKLEEIGYRKFRVANTQLLSYMNDNYPQTELYASTSLEYKTMKEYQNFLEMYPFVKNMALAHDINKNFKLLKNLKLQYPNFEFEIMANEGCMGGCPNRVAHASTVGKQNLYYTKQCGIQSHKDLYLWICKSHNIFPWDIEEYVKLGFLNFKLVGRNLPNFPNAVYYNGILAYLNGVDDEKMNKNLKLGNLIHYMSYLDFLPYIKDVKPYLPNIKHFVKNGHLCASICKSECSYCYKCAEEMHKRFPLS